MQARTSQVVKQRSNNVDNKRHCGTCSLCCKLLPMPELNKASGKACKHQRFGKGCRIYADRPRSCRLWSCIWLTHSDAGSLHRPDRVHYVIDPSPDYVTVKNDEASEPMQVSVIQIWVDPDFPDAHRDPALRDFLERQSRKYRCLGIVRLSSERAFILAPPAISEDGQWHENMTVELDEAHSVAKRIKYGLPLELETRQ
jgi:Pyruvate/2-oxoacid:ferredoxin oxidoreductase delta subunit